jgi:hypothetical protein
VSPQRTVDPLFHDSAEVIQTLYGVLTIGIDEMTGTGGMQGQADWKRSGRLTGHRRRGLRLRRCSGVSSTRRRLERKAVRIPGRVVAPVPLAQVRQTLKHRPGKIISLNLMANVLAIID